MLGARVIAKRKALLISPYYVSKSLVVNKYNQGFHPCIIDGSQKKLDRPVVTLKTRPVSYIAALPKSPIGRASSKPLLGQCLGSSA